MTWPTIIAVCGFVVFFLIYIIPAVSVTCRLLGSDFFDPWQTRMQLLIVWFVPILGAALVAAMLLPHIQVKRGRIPLLELLVLSAFVSSLNQGDNYQHSGVGDIESAHEDL
jgi:hypothetical protein